MEPGWRVDETRPERLRWWTGEGWGHDTVLPEALPRRLARARLWAAVTCALLALSALTLLLAVRVDLRNVALLDLLPGLEDDPVAQQEILQRVGVSASRSTAWTWFPLVGAAVAWSTWHFHLVQLLPSLLTRRTPDAQALLWWVPGVNLVTAPLLLVSTRRTLQGRRDRRPGLLVVAWWVGWVALGPWLLVVMWRWVTVDGLADYRAHFVATVPLQLAVVVTASLGAAIVVVVTRDAAAYVARSTTAHPAAQPAS